MSIEQRYRLVVLGSGKVGKTSLIRRYLYKEFTDRYKETVEDLHSRDFRIHGVTLSLDILDTNFNYPDMRRLAVASANAFLLVFAVDDVNSFKDMSELWSEIKQRRLDLDQLPTVIVGNKADSATKKIYPETVGAFVSRLGTSSEVRYVEASAKSGINVPNIFRNLLDVSGFPERQQQHPTNDGSLSARQLTSRPDFDDNDQEESSSLSVGGGITRRGRSMRGRLNGKPARGRPSSAQRNYEEEQQETTLGQHKLLGHLLVRESSPNMLSATTPANTPQLSRNRSVRLQPTTTTTTTTVRKGEVQKPEPFGEHAPKGFTRHGSLMRRTKHLSMRLKKVGDTATKPNEVDQDESDCKIS